MASVTGFTADRMLEIEGESINGGSVDGSGNLILSRRNGTSVNAGHVVGPAGDPSSLIGPANAYTDSQLIVAKNYTDVKAAANAALIAANTADIATHTSQISAIQGVNTTQQTKLDKITAWASFTPTWTASPSPVLGNGTLVGRYALIDKTMHISIVLTMGSTTTFSAGNWNFGGLPVNQATLGARLYIPAMGFDNSAGRVWPLFAYWINAGTIALMSMPATANGSLVSVTSTNPITWAVGDTIVINGSFETV